MSFDPETHDLVCDRCRRVESPDEDLCGWGAEDDGKNVCPGCHTGAELAERNKLEQIGLASFIRMATRRRR